MRRNLLLIILVFCLMGFSLFGYAQEVKEKKNKPVSAESLEQLVKYILSALGDNDSQRLEQIITGNSQLIRGNKLLTIQICGTLLNEAVEKELAGKGESENNYLKVARMVAEIYKNASGSNYLLEKAAIFQKWSKKEKEKYQKAEELYGRGEELRKKYGYDEAVDCYDQGISLYREIGYHVGEANCLKSLGDVHRMLSEYEKARQRYEQALSIQKQILDHHGMIWSYYRLGQIFEALQQYPQAQQNYQYSIEKIEEVREEMKREEFKTAFFASKLAPYEALIDLRFKLGKGESAFDYAQRSKARSFLDLLANKKIDLQKAVGIPLKLVREEEELKQAITSLTTKIMEIEKTGGQVPGKMVEQLLQLKQQHTGKLLEIKLQSPEYASLKSVNPLQEEEIQALVREGQMVLLEYYTTASATYLWLLDGKNIHAYAIAITRPALETKIREFHTMAANETFGVETLAGRAHELYDLLLLPAEAHLKGKPRIAVIPHGSLHYLPFEALMKNGKFLAEQNIKIFYLPSASTFKYCRGKNHIRKEQLIGIGNPDGTLPFSKIEVQQLQRLYPGDTEIFTGKQATEYRIKEKYAKLPDILHFSCHGSFNAGYPLYSALLLGKNEIDDGRLEVHEIFQLNLKPAYLVTLSACETHLGGIRPGDEIIGMSRAFIYAGTPSILASLWKVDDYYTSKLMVAFYRALKQTDKLDALQAARKTMIEDYGKRHPYYWSGFVLIGDYR